MDLAVLGVGVGEITQPHTSNADDIILDVASLASSLSPIHQHHHLLQQPPRSHQHQQLHRQPQPQQDNSCSSMSVDERSKDGSAMAMDVEEEGNGDGEDEFVGLFCLEPKDLDVRDAGVVGGSSQGTILVPSLFPSIIKTNTVPSSIVPAPTNTNTQDPQPNILDIDVPYPPPPHHSDFQDLSLLGLSTPSSSKPFGSLSDFNIDDPFGIGGLVDTFSSGGGYDSIEGDESVRVYHGHGHAQRGSESYSIDLSNASIPTTNTNSASVSIEPERLMHYDAHGRILHDANGLIGSGKNMNTNGSEAEDSLSFILSGLEGPRSPRVVNRMRDPIPVSRMVDTRMIAPPEVTATTAGAGMVDGGLGRRYLRPPPSMGVEPMSILRRNSVSGGANGSARGGRRVNQTKTKTVQPMTIQSNQYLGAGMPLALPIPTRSRPMMVKGWQGDSAENQSAGARKEVKQPVGVPYSDGGRKRKRLDDEGEDEVESMRDKNLRREMLGLRAISRGSSEEGDEGESERKRRRVGSLTVPLTSLKGKERQYQDDDDSGSEYSSDSSSSDAYCPSRSSSPANGKYGSSSRTLSTASSGRRSGSAQTMSTATTSMSPSNDDADENYRRRNRGKAKGSAALALAKVTMMSGKSPTSPWGTYAPFPVEEDAPEPAPLQSDDAAEIRAGRRRRNGHIPLPVPIPHLIKKSRGRKVPYVAGSSKKKGSDEEWKRMFVCEVPGCGKCFVRGEHLKRHVRSIHTHDKRTLLPSAQQLN
ncbi:hypothetical protein NP233_g8295 [Leucocoprinus birnbaumii]|uniref:C2H2-type domain-containing protein n=1 Tax=Leucocoprinus birnbaumii TaxID=56174 RepID=A0AAD5VML4_9AGAR|nr:hypothetical protein NP233_g8295 [Leucocoprinus birnbaumii]